MTELIIGIALSAIGGLTILWYRHPKSYEQLMPYLMLGSLAVAITLLGFWMGWQEGFRDGTAWLREFETYLDLEPRPEKEPVPDYPDRMPVYILVSFGLALYFSFLPKLRELIDVEAHENERDDEKSG